MRILPCTENQFIDDLESVSVSNFSETSRPYRSANPGLFVTWSMSTFDEGFTSPGPGLCVLPDTGAVGNVCGEAWAQQAVTECERLGLPYKATKLRVPRGHNGVGSGAVSCEWTISVPMPFGKRCFTYTADVIPSPNVPALMGLHDMAALDVHFAVKSGTFIIPGPGGLRWNASPGTESVQMRRVSENHHWFLPANQQLKKTWLSLPHHERKRRFEEHGGKQILYDDSPF